MKRIRWFTIVSPLFPAVLLALLFLVPHQPAFAHGATILRVEPPELTINLGETGANAVQMVDVDNFYGGEFAIEYDKDCVEVVDADPNTPGVQIGVGAVFTERGTRTGCTGLGLRMASPEKGRITAYTEQRTLRAVSRTACGATVSAPPDTVCRAPAIATLTETSPLQGPRPATLQRSYEMGVRTTLPKVTSSKS